MNRATTELLRLAVTVGCKLAQGARECVSIRKARLQQVFDIPSKILLPNALPGGIERYRILFTGLKGTFNYPPNFKYCFQASVKFLKAVAYKMGNFQGISNN